MSKRPILILVEGEITDTELMKHLLTTYGIYEEHQIVSYGTSIYSLYDSMFRNRKGTAVADISLHLRERETDPDKSYFSAKGSQEYY
jgi:hypothetical protein